MVHSSDYNAFMKCTMMAFQCLNTSFVNKLSQPFKPERIPSLDGREYFNERDHLKS